MLTLQITTEVNGMTKVYTETRIYANPDEDLVITTKRKNRNNVPPFFMGGRVGTIRSKKMGYPLLDVMADMTKPEAWFFKELRHSMDIRTSVGIMKNGDLSLSDRQKKKLAYAPLKEKDLVRRVKKETYMINPDALIYPETYEESKKAWLMLKGDYHGG